MRKALSVLLSIAVLLSLSACRREEAPSLLLAPAKLTENEESLLSLVSPSRQAAVFDYAADESARSLTVSCYELGPDGAWSPLSSDKRWVDSTRGRIAVSFDVIGNGVRVAFQEEGGTSSFEFHPEETVDLEGLGVATSFAGGEAEIIYEQEIPLAVQTVAGQGVNHGSKAEDFLRPGELLSQGCAHVYAITALFSRQE